ncbi:nucleotidyltransferase family protein [Isachenkonia alkalipeptolytica]|uniref:Nucleotidyltransferase family protein n=1 Tax=Isachenkonia alkalipeptolytica TaxID=2565777 RepID=A0AA43XL94_9CLOT|nr:nucleotidyltransferase family protein [Isachenkonia alkalipeptolytica]NBG88717.1 nucleotidyltransferase family protein [Isachenkonia alkalipeptolytica]
MVTGIVMAAGLSRRMGVNKLLMCIDNTPLIKRTLKIIEASKLEKLIVVYSDPAVLEVIREYEGEKEEGEASPREIKPVYNPHPEKGQSESVKTGMYESHPKSRGYMFFVADQPFLKPEVIDRIVDTFMEQPEHIVVPTYQGNRGMPILFPGKYRLDLLGVSGDKGGRSIIDENQDQTIFLPIEDPKVGEDMDTIEDYEKICEIDAERRG